jgi:pectinesterase
VILVGDSTMAPGTGYGDALCGLFAWQVECVNLARGGRSTKSYRVEGWWERAQKLMRDRARASNVLVQFGHNDQPGRPERSTDLATEYPANLARYVEDIRAEHAEPVLLTPLTRRQFAEGRLKDDLAPWAEAMRRVAAGSKVPLLDLNADSAAAVARMGPRAADTLARPPGHGFDHTHVGPRGAGLFARMVAAEIAAGVPDLAAHLVVGAVEPPGPVKRPQLTAAEAERFTYGKVLGDFDPARGTLADRGAAPDLVVDAATKEDARATFRTVQAAIDAAVARAWGGGQRERVHILVRPGIYDERVEVPSAAPPITLEGQEADARAVRIRWNLDAAHAGSTPASASFRVRARGFQARNLSIENTHNKERGDRSNQSQAVALMLDDADHASFENVRVIGFQDTLYLAASSPERPARAYFERSYVEGDMDFIFGEATAYFRDSEIRSLGDRAVSYVLAPSTHVKSPYGFVFDGCRFTHDGSPNARAGFFKLARQWNRSPEHVGKVAILNSSIGAHIDSVRPWADWSIGTPRHRPVQYEYLTEFNNTGEHP